MVVMSALVVMWVGMAVEGSRVLSLREDFGFAGRNHLQTYASVYEQAKTSMSFWLQRLASGPSPKGPGH
ncbi:putative transmembrane protein [Senna tora]|uniref:Putative transmembrane protein n=1 Tax=Senna tora TaxID=362788 RepID=A0A834SME2_9FABA|nr:putative transmembrane protein [Senna tora]